MWPRTHRGAVRRQLELRDRLVLRGAPRRVRSVAGADISYGRGSDRFFAAVVVLSWPGLEILEEAAATGKSPFPYIPGLLSFREGPLLLRAFAKLDRRPDLVLFDGHGVAHPRRFGVASHLGLLLGIPSIGCAKRRLVGEHGVPGPTPGDSTPLSCEGRRVGAVLRTRRGVKPIFVSCGHGIGLAAALRWAFRLCDGHRLPAPLRAAHLLSNRLRQEASSRSSSPA
ncbi:MAG: deoxyribonuclease V [Planctomycetota bacterium]